MRIIVTLDPKEIETYLIEKGYIDDNLGSKKIELSVNRNNTLCVAITTYNENYTDEQLELLTKPIMELPLKIRAKNCLKLAGAANLGEAIKFERNYFFKYRNVGEKSLSEIEKLLATKKLHFLKKDE